MPLDLRVIKHLRSLAAGRTKFKQKKGKGYFDKTVSESDRDDVHGGYCHGALERFAEAKGHISKTGLAELHRFLMSNV